MKYLYILVTVIIFTNQLLAQPPVDYTVRIEAQVQKLPAQITLNWITTTDTGKIYISRKAKGAITWTAIATLPSTSTTYADNNVTAGTGYEYRIEKNDPTKPIGYIYAGIELPAVHKRGAMVLLVDSTFSSSCNSEIQILMKDLSGDGWEVIRKDFPRTETVVNVKQYIVNASNTNPDVNALFILGHVAIPYSGFLNPDGHTNHKGAWPADAYYGEIDSTWEDVLVNNTSSLNPLNHNTPGDGKYDANYFPTEIELQVGRVDFYDMPAFNKTEDQLMKSYLNKLHKYKTGQLNVIKRGLVDDNFKGYSEKFGSNAWRNFAPLVGIDSVAEKDLVSTLNTDFHQWAFGCGGGSFYKCAGVGDTADFIHNDMNNIFMMLFGSYFGDWNYKNNVMRATMCSDEPTLACFWGGRPNWHLHHMALGENIGYSVRLTQNNDTVYYTPLSYLSKTVNISFLGDPTLRTDYSKVLPAVTISNTPEAGAIISWSASTDPSVTGYYVYRSKSEFGKYELRSPLVSGTTFTDSFGAPGTYWYMVRAAKIENTPSGTYTNLSVGSSQSGSFTYPYFDVGIPSTSVFTEVKLFPNPAQGLVHVEMNCVIGGNAVITVNGIDGKILSRQTTAVKAGRNTTTLNIHDIPAGMYFVAINMRVEETVFKLVKTN